MKYTIEEHEEIIRQGNDDCMTKYMRDLLTEVKRLQEIMRDQDIVQDGGCTSHECDDKQAELEARLADAVETLKYYANATWDDGGFEGEHAKIILCAGNEAGYKRAKDCLSRISGGQAVAGYR